MLYDPKWEKPETKPDVFSLAGLIAWLEMQPAKKEYCALPEGSCLLGQFASAMGHDDPLQASIMLGNTHPFDRIAYYNLRERDCTFGAALARARKLASSPVQP